MAVFGLYTTYIIMDSLPSIKSWPTFNANDKLMKSWSSIKGRLIHETCANMMSNYLFFFFFIYFYCVILMNIVALSRHLSLNWQMTNLFFFLSFFFYFRLFRFVKDKNAFQVPESHDVFLILHSPEKLVRKCRRWNLENRKNKEKKE